MIILLLVFGFSAAGAAILFFVAAPLKYALFAALVPLSWLAIKWVPVEKA